MTVFIVIVPTFQYTCTCIQANLTCIHVKKNTDTGFIGMVDNDTHTHNAF